MRPRRDANQTLDEFERVLEDLIDHIDGADLEECVEIGAALWEMSAKAKAACDQVKVILRDEAIEDTAGAPGTHRFDGADRGRASVSIPYPKLRLASGVSIPALQTALGPEFPNYFETRTTYKPRKGVDAVIVKLASGDTLRDVLLNAIETYDETPRVSFTRENR